MVSTILKRRGVLLFLAGCAVGVVSGYAIPREVPPRIGTGGLTLAERSIDLSAEWDGQVPGPVKAGVVQHYRGTMTFGIHNNGKSPVRLKLPLLRVEVMRDASLTEIEWAHSVCAGPDALNVIAPGERFTFAVPYALMASTLPADQRFIFSFDRPDDDATGEFLVGAFETPLVTWKCSTETDEAEKH